MYKNVLCIIKMLNADKCILKMKNVQISLFKNVYYYQDERTFSEDEEEKLQTSLGLPGPDLELVLQSLEFFLQQVTD